MLSCGDIILKNGNFPTNISTVWSKSFPRKSSFVFLSSHDSCILWLANMLLLSSSRAGCFIFPSDLSFCCLVSILWMLTVFFHVRAVLLAACCRASSAIPINDSVGCAQLHVSLATAMSCCMCSFSVLMSLPHVRWGGVYMDSVQWPQQCDVVEPLQYQWKVNSL